MIHNPFWRPKGTIGLVLSTGAIEVDLQLHKPSVSRTRNRIGFIFLERVKTLAANSQNSAEGEEAKNEDQQDIVRVTKTRRKRNTRDMALRRSISLKVNGVVIPPQILSTPYEITISTIRHLREDVHMVYNSGVDDVTIPIPDSSTSSDVATSTIYTQEGDIILLPKPSFAADESITSASSAPYQIKISTIQIQREDIFPGPGSSVDGADDRDIISHVSSPSKFRQSQELGSQRDVFPVSNSVADDRETISRSSSTSKFRRSLQELRAQMASAMTSTSALTNHHHSYNLDGSPDLYQPSIALQELQVKIEQEQDPKRKKSMTKKYIQKQNAEIKKAKKEYRALCRLEQETRKKVAISKLVARRLHNDTAERCEDICHPELSATRNTTLSPFRMITYFDLWSNGRPKLKTLDNNPPKLSLQVRKRIHYRTRINLFLENRKGSVIAQAKLSDAAEGVITFDSWKLARKEKRVPLLIPLEKPGNDWQKYDFALPLSNEDAVHQVDWRYFTWERIVYSRTNFEVEFELRKASERFTSGEGEVLAMLTYKRGFCKDLGRAKITMKRGFGGDVVREGADRLQGWTDWEVMVLMSGLCIVEAYKTRLTREGIVGCGHNLPTPSSWFSGVPLLDIFSPLRNQYRPWGNRNRC